MPTTFSVHLTVPALPYQCARLWRTEASDTLLTASSGVQLSCALANVFIVHLPKLPLPEKKRGKKGKTWSSSRGWCLLSKSISAKSIHHTWLNRYICYLIFPVTHTHTHTHTLKPNHTGVSTHPAATPLTTTQCTEHTQQHFIWTVRLHTLHRFWSVEMQIQSF